MQERLNVMGARFVRHGDARKKTAEYRTWCGMRQRCYAEGHISFKNYGGRGIKVCERWLESYENFFADMGRKPSPKHSIDRIDNDADYEPGNCRWATQSEQLRNRRPISADTRAKISAALTGKTLSAGHRAKLSAAHLGITPSPEIRAKLSAAAKAQHARRRSNNTGLQHWRHRETATEAPYSASQSEAA